LWLMWWWLVVNVWNGEGLILWEKKSVEVDVVKLCSGWSIFIFCWWMIFGSPFLFATQSLFIVAMR
jgi:hypothetical protein